MDTVKAMDIMDETTEILEGWRTNADEEFSVIFSEPHRRVNGTGKNYDST